MKWHDLNELYVAFVLLSPSSCYPLTYPERGFNNTNIEKGNPQRQKLGFLTSGKEKRLAK
jgi:hypothetical protein